MSNFPIISLNKLTTITPERKEKALHDLMWVPVTGKETEVWASRSNDGKRIYNVRKEWSDIHTLKPVSTWVALWSHKDDTTPNVVTIKFLSRYDAQNFLQDFENGFTIDRREIEEENRKIKEALSKNSNGVVWSFQGVFDGISIWSYRDLRKPEVCYVIMNDRVRLPNKYSLSRREFGDPKKGKSKLYVNSLGVYESLESAQKVVNSRINKLK